MNYRIVTSLFICLCLSCCRSNNAPLTNEEVTAVINRFDEGWKFKDLKAVDSVLAPQYSYFTQSGGTFSRDSVVQTAGSSSYSLEKVNRSEPHE